MTNNDQNLIQQMIRAGKMDAIRDLLPEYHQARAERMIEEMGEKYILHSKNHVKRLKTPLAH